MFEKKWVKEVRYLEDDLFQAGRQMQMPRGGSRKASSMAVIEGSIDEHWDLRREEKVQDLRRLEKGENNESGFYFEESDE